jgi:endonuclease-3 related protein
MKDAKPKPPLTGIYKALFRRWGPQHWWPGRSRFEMMIGAILTQNTAWTNVEKAIRRLKKARALTPASINAMPERDLAELIRPSGSFNVKARRIKNFTRWMKEEHGEDMNRLFRTKTEKLRHDLLSINGIGKETADSILLYAGQRPVFVVDAYTRRFMLRHEWIHEKATYDEIANMYADAYTPLSNIEKVAVFNEYHALIVTLAKNHCRANPDCKMCPLRKWLPETDG